MSGVETSDGDIRHLASIVQTELEPGVLSEVFRQSLESSSVVSIIVVIVAVLSDRVMGRVGLEINIRCFNIPSVVKS